MSESSAWSEFAKWLGQAVVVGIGWFVVHRLSVQRDRDKARREIIAKSADALIDALGPVLVSARSYHCSPRDEQVELQLKMTLQDLSLRVQGLSDICGDGAKLTACRIEIGNLRRAITGRHFEDERTGPLLLSDGQLENVAGVVLQAKRQLLRLKHLQFPAEGLEP